MSHRSARAPGIRGVLWLAGAGLLAALTSPTLALGATWSTLGDVPFPKSYAAFLDENTGAGAYVLPGRPSGLLAWETPGAADDAPSSSTLVPLRLDGTLGRQRNVPGDFVGASFDVRGAATVLLTGESVEPPDGERVMTGVTWRRFDRTGKPGRGAELTEAVLGVDPVIAGNRRGDAVAVWLESLDGTRVLRMSAHAAGAGNPGFSDPVTLGTDPKETGLISAAVSEDGRVLIAYGAALRGEAANTAKRTAAQMVAWTGRIGGRLTGPVPLGRRAASTSVSASSDGRGRSYVVWQGSGRRASPQLASLAPRAKTFTPAVDLAPGRRAFAEPLLATDPAGGAVVVWSRFKPYGLMAASIDALGRRAAVQQVGSGLPIDVAARGGTAVIATDPGDASEVVKFSVRPTRSGRFGALERAGRETFYGARDMLGVDPDGRVRVTTAVDADGDRAPRLVTLVRTP